ncbi:MAG: type I secretion system permease/ATPase [Boseongicola sp.]|nr:MAG: type I secretion system permease/ATPase [Boseongicola sp.]
MGSVLVFSIFTNLLMLTGPLFMLQVYDRVLASRSEETLVALFALVALLYFFYWLLEYARGRVLARAGARFQSQNNNAVFRAVLERAAHRRSSKGTLQDIETVRAFFTSPVALAVFDIPWTPVFLAAIFLFHPLLGWLAAVGGGILIAIAILNQILTRKETADSAQLTAMSIRLSRQAEDAGELVWAQSMVRTMSDRWIATQDKAVKASLSAADWTGSFGAFTKAFRLFLQSAVLALGAWLVLQGDITAGAMIAASILLGRALAPVELGVSQWQAVQRARAAGRALRDLLEEFPERDVPTKLPVPAAHLIIRGVTDVVRRGDKPVLHSVSFDIEPGQAVGIIGRSGAGKSSLAKVIVGLRRPASGEVRLDNATLEQYGPDSLGNYIGYLPQDVLLFDGTIAENIAQMQMSPDPDKVVRAAQKARVHDIILKLPEGYDTPIGSSSAHLSGGQKQRLALARAIFNDPVLLVLDEPNSALDNEGSEALNAVVAQMKAEKKAVLIMTHRPNAISTCDNLLVLDGGRVAAFGPRDEIINSMMKNAGEVQRAVGGAGDV